MKCNASLGRTRLTGHYSVNKLSMTEILFGTPNSKTKGSLGLLLKISTENPGLSLSSDNLQFHERNKTIHVRASCVVCLSVKLKT